MRMLQSDRGFTLVETMVALTILAAGMAGVGTMFYDSMAKNVQSLSDRNVDSVAQAIIEDLKGQFAQIQFSDVDNITLTDPKFNPPKYATAGQTGSGASLVNYVDKRGIWGGFVYKWRAEQQRNIEGTGWEPMTKLCVTVAWDTNQSQALFPRDPDDPHYWRQKSKICNFVMSK